MKKILLFIAIIATSLASFAQVNIEDIVKPGTKLIYAVESRGMKYDFIITVKQLTPVVIFDWEMTDPVNINGTITHTEKAMQSANTMFNFFRPGDKTLDDATACVWLSRDVIAGLSSKAGIAISTDVGAPQRTFAKKSDNDLEVLINGKKKTLVESMAKEITNPGDDFFTYSNSAKLPIIYRFKGSFYIALKEVKN